jgi:signal transduction histidine kinase
LVISSFKVFGNELPFTADQPDIQLSYAQNFFSFEFSALKKYPDTGLRYGYKLNGFDPEWIDAGTKNFAGYTNVPAGHYQFQVRTKNETGPWSPVLLTIPIAITPPFWRTWWFFSAAFLTIALLLYAIYRYRVAQIKKIFTLRSKISQDLHDEVGSALSSIHLFSTVASRSLEANPVVVKNALNNIHQNSRNVMEKMSDMIWAIHTGKAGENTLEQRLKNYGYELLSPLDIRCEYQVDPGLEHMLQHIETRKNVLLIIKEAMNNIAKYSGATDSQVRLKIRDGFLEIAISDNGRGFTPSAKKDGHGIGSMQRRTEELKGKFSIQSSPGQGTTVNCYIPIPSFRGRRIHNQA